MHILSIRHLQLPGLDSIPEIQQKLDSFWLNSQYQKSLQITREHATSWVKKMYKAYIFLLTLIHNEGTQHLQQLLIEKEALQHMKNATLQRLKTPPDQTSRKKRASNQTTRGI